MKAVEVYTDIQEKNISSDPIELSDTEALIHALNVLDFNAALTSVNPDLPKAYDPIEWIELKWIANDQQ